MSVRHAGAVDVGESALRRLRRRIDLNGLVEAALDLVQRAEIGDRRDVTARSNAPRAPAPSPRRIRTMSRLLWNSGLSGRSGIARSEEHGRRCRFAGQIGGEAPAR
jgi:hypothetical protein